MKLSYEDGKSIYEQIVEQFKYKVAKGYLVPGDSIPSVRKLALELQITPNTVAKAYQQLEQDGIILTIPGKGTYIRTDIQIPQDDSRRKDISRRLQSVLLEMKLMGLNRQEILKLTENLYKELENKGEETRDDRGK